ncbi:hemerythrin domain-containing protein [Alicyclobacillus shizuokensis]|uniref:hemerythrin domain-containing protein n=1 Tax=Alicyclobacillus shizuokensis TaxID=392014 RepID=UPI000833D086|nr:hemerythrin domain-containing protein [Alicyclobacillus shizuokensis]
MQRVSLAFRDKQVESLLQHGQAKFVQLSLRPGEELIQHRTPFALTVIVVSGEIRFTMEEEERTLVAPCLLTVGAGVEHAVEALTTSVVLLVLSPEAGADADTSARVADRGRVFDRELEQDNAYQHPEWIQQIAPELRSLVEDHISLCKVLLGLGEKPSVADIRRALQAVAGELCRHFPAEEEVVFPRVASHVGGADVGPVAGLMEEHAHIRRLHGEAENLLNALQQEPDAHLQSLLESKVEELSLALLNHLGKEDSHLFPMASRILSADEKQAIAEELHYLAERH